MPLTLQEYEKLNPVSQVKVGDRTIYYAIPNSMTKWRVDTLRTKEPDTIEWIDTFEKEDVFVDIGANIGMYTLYAAVTREINVFAFEPESQNYALLNKNIFQNKLGNLVTAYCVGLSDEVGMDMLNLSNFGLGGSCHSVGDEVGYDLQPRAPGFKQGCAVNTLDNLVKTGVVPSPAHIKIDVDGIEHKVISGCNKVLESEGLKSVLVELNWNLNEHKALADHMINRGFNFDMDKFQANCNSGDFIGLGNCIFYRS